MLKIPILTEDGKSVWPERFSVKKIKELLYRSGPYKFNSQMLLIPPEETDNFFDISMLKIYSGEIKVLTANGNTLYMLNDIKLDFGIISWDPSLGKLNGDSSTVVSIFKSGDKIFIHDIKYIKSENNQVNAKQQCKEVKDFMEKNNLHNIILETNGIGAFLSSTLKEISHQEKYIIIITEKNQKENKNERIINTLQPLLYGGNFYINSEISSQKLIYELQTFKPNLTNNTDDTCDAITTGIRSTGGKLNRSIICNEYIKNQTYKAKTNFKI